MVTGRLRHRAGPNRRVTEFGGRHQPA
jgi:hypothetical protein